jgi:hypothetical protein
VDCPPTVKQYNQEGHKLQVHQEQQHAIHDPSNIWRGNQAIRVLGSDDKGKVARACLLRWGILI